MHVGTHTLKLLAARDASAPLGLLAPVCADLGLALDGAGRAGGGCVPALVAGAGGEREGFGHCC